MHQNPIDTYASIQKENLSGRELEASILTRAGIMLKTVKENWDASDRDEKLMEAIKFNQKVWSFFQAELTDPENPLPRNLRQDILNLSVFVDKRLFEIMANLQPDPENLGIIIDINFNIAAGLRSKPDQSEQS